MKKTFLLCIICVAVIVNVSAQTNKASRLYNLVTQHNKTGLRKINLFTETDTSASVNKKAGKVMSAFAALKISVPAVLDIAASKPRALQLEIPFSRYKNFTLNLLRQKLNNDGNFSFGTLQNNHVKTKVSGESGVHYRGYINGDSTSMASISFFKDGTIMALFANSKGNFIVGRMGNDKSDYIVYNDRNLLVPSQIKCGTTNEHVYGRPIPEGSKPPVTPQGLPPTLCNKVMLYWEGDFELYDYNFNSDLTATQNYMEGLFNEVAAMYQNEGIIVESSGMAVWTSADPYRNNTSNNGLADFQANWNANNNEFGGDLAHLIAGGETNNGGLAFLLGDFCSNKDYAYGYSNVWGAYEGIPAWSWDVEVVTHETGHNFGSYHTQWCGWNTGPNGSCGAIDNCYTLETGSGCNTCPSTTDTASLPDDWQGSVMSYCHLSSIGINLANGFGPLPQELIRSAVANATGCLRSIIAATATATPICNNNDGAVTLTYDSDNLGVAPYTYLWTPGDYTTQNIASLSIPGTYSVDISDNAGCTANYSADVKALSDPGQFVPLNIAQPVCCMETNDSITLKTLSPEVLNDCETIGWIRSKTELKTYDDVLNAYAIAPASDLFFSTSITDDNAILKIKPPVSCTADSTWYYAAFISKKQVDGAEITGASSGGGNVTGSDGTVIGRYVTIADQNASVAECLENETPTIILKVDVRLYTGRANFLSIVIEDENFNYLTGVFNQAGQGVYEISLPELGSIPLDRINILCYDYNCDDNSCVDAGVLFTATRTVTYKGIAQPTVEEACAVAASQKLSFSSNTAQCTVLAAAFTNFNVSENNCAVNVNWQTTNEAAGNSFEVERSTDGRLFLPVAVIQPKGQALNNYGFVDEGAASGSNYYRIKETDADGKITYTQARMIELACSGKDKVKLYPNPAYSEINIRSAQAVSRVEVINNAGQVLIKANGLNYQSGISRLNVSRLLSGVYVCKITLADGSVENIKFVKN